MIPMYICFPAARGHIRLLQNKLGCDTQVNVVHRRRRSRSEFALGGDTTLTSVMDSEREFRHPTHALIRLRRSVSATF